MRIPGETDLSDKRERACECECECEGGKAPQTTKGDAIYYTAHNEPSHRNGLAVTRGGPLDTRIALAIAAREAWPRREAAA